MKEKNQNKFGFGFGNAMFAMKDLQDMYGQFDSKPQQIKKTSQNKVISTKNNQTKPNLIAQNKKVELKNSQKPKIILKPPQNNSVTKKIPSQNADNIKDKQTTINNKTDFVLHSSKCFQIIPFVFELTQNPQPTSWKFFTLDEKNGKKTFQLVQNPQITFSFNQRNIKQGTIGNCYFICSLAALTQNIQILKQRIPNAQKYPSKSQYFIVNMFESGKLVQSKVTNYFNPFYSKPINNDVTPLILEKAYAQLYGGYDIINVGHSIDAFRDLSGNIAQYIDLKNKEKAIKQIKEAFELNHPMVIASKQSPKNQSISAKHSYNILSYSQTNNEFYLQLRDPRGWTKAHFYSPENLQVNPQNGQFWISYKDLIENFEVITVSRYIKDSHYFYKTFAVKDLLKNGMGGVSFHLKEKTILSVSIHQKHKKFFDQAHQYNVVNLMLCQVDDKMNIKRTIKCDFNSNQVCSFQQTLQEGKYALIGQIYPLKVKQQKYSEQIFTLSINSNGKVEELNLLRDFNLEKGIILYMKENLNEFKQVITKEGLYRYHGSLFGKVCILYENHSDKNVIEELQFTVENVEVTERKVMLGRGQKKLIMCPIGGKNNCSHKCSFKSKTFYSK